MFHCTEILHFFNRAFMVKCLQKHLFVVINILCPDLAKFLISQKISKLFTNNYRGLQKCNMLSCQKWNGNICCHQFAACFKLWIFLKKLNPSQLANFWGFESWRVLPAFFWASIPIVWQESLTANMVSVSLKQRSFTFPSIYCSFLCFFPLHMISLSQSLSFLLRSLSLSILRPVYLSPSLHGDWLEAWIHHS